MVGVPVVIGSKGVERIVEIELAGKDREGFDKSVGAVQGWSRPARRSRPTCSASKAALRR